jgi:hypothetical protein
MTSTGSAGAITPSRLATHGSVGPCISVNTPATMKTTSNSAAECGTWALTGMVASTIGTAPRRPAQDRNARSRPGSRNGSVAASTAAGRARNTRTRPTAMAGRIWAGSRAGEASKPSMTNSPIWASQPIPSAKPRVAGPCGSRALPSTTADT